MMRLLTCALSGLLFMAAPVYAQTHGIDDEFITEWLLLGPFSSAELDKMKEKS